VAKTIAKKKTVGKKNSKKKSSKKLSKNTSTKLYPNLTSWKKGQSGNPDGRPSQRLDESRKINAKVARELLNKYLDMPAAELKKIVKSGKTKGVDLMIATCILKGAYKGDSRALNFMFDRLVGKVKEVIDHSSSDGTMSPKEQLTSEQKKAMAKIVLGESSGK